jgi:hypothetical protein
MGVHRVLMQLRRLKSALSLCSGRDKARERGKTLGMLMLMFGAMLFKLMRRQRLSNIYNKTKSSVSQHVNNANPRRTSIF